MIPISQEQYVVTCDSVQVSKDKSRVWVKSVPVTDSEVHTVFTNTVMQFIRFKIRILSFVLYA